MSKVILDASALITLIKKETGSKIIEKFMGRIVMSTVNISEVFYILFKSGLSDAECESCIKPLVSDIKDFDWDIAYFRAVISRLNKDAKLSFGEQACIALGIKMGLPIYTACENWANLNVGTMKIVIIR